jgi:CubicO group peptidase (beta-lactamase class C family)
MRRTFAIRPTASPSRAVRRHGLLLAFLALPLVTARAGEPPDLPRAKPEDVGISSERLRRVDDVIQRYIDAKKISGAVTLVARRGKVVHHEARGLMDVESGTPMRKDAIFRMASSTKPVTGVAIMMLIEEGKIGLTDPVSKFLPEFKGMKVAVEKDGEVQLVAAEREVTIRDLLTHTSGLASGGIGQRKAPAELLRPGGAGATLAEAAGRYAAVPLDFQPGTRWRYSGLAGIDLLSRIVEVASGQSYDEFLRRRIFEPLGMRETSFFVPEDRRDRQVAIYRRAGNGLEKTPSFIRFPETYFSGAGGLSSTAADYFRFAQMLADGGQLDGKRLLSPRGVEMYASNHVGVLFAGQAGRPKGMGFGLTVEVVVDPVQAGTFRSRGSFGWDGAFGTHFWVDPEERLVAVLLIQTSGRDLHRDFETAVMQSIID